MIRTLMLVLTSRYTIGIVSLLICIPMFITLIEVSKVLWVKPDMKEEMDIVTGIGIIMIGWGVLLEERRTLREIFGLLDGPDEAWQAAIDHACHNYGVGQLSIGLMAEICIELIKIPNTIIYTGEVDDYLVAAGLFFVGVGALLLIRHVLVMLFFLPRSVPATH
ncbi:MAG: hypothetical protein EPO10_08935 [Reyranella sp.]|uniref:hypothetical protein n=1 Tax=Reyranella sp. TaxID=1929291 RepID=UPI001229F086|nr:hypothetical protein [Reyranella sp.]TAJ93065.1 MAG: hypothetical protein EPO41_12515 [Reyranella sp.]TBR29244.1 MAG: hypothetical protein EPO10_08935 [Reyranella sp.]